MTTVRHFAEYVETTFTALASVQKVQTKFIDLMTGKLSATLTVAAKETDALSGKTIQAAFKVAMLERDTLTGKLAATEVVKAAETAVIRGQLAAVVKVTARESEILTGKLASSLTVKTNGTGTVTGRVAATFKGATKETPSLTGALVLHPIVASSETATLGSAALHIQAALAIQAQMLANLSLVPGPILVVNGASGDDEPGDYQVDSAPFPRPGRSNYRPVYYSDLETRARLEREAMLRNRPRHIVSRRLEAQAEAISALERIQRDLIETNTRNFKLREEEDLALLLALTW